MSCGETKNVSWIRTVWRANMGPAPGRQRTMLFQDGMGGLGVLHLAHGILTETHETIKNFHACLVSG